MTDIIFIKRKDMVVTYQELEHKPVDVELKKFVTACIGSRVTQNEVTYDWGGLTGSDVLLTPVKGGRYFKKPITELFDKTLTEITMTKAGFQELFVN